jgi:hypothetical protein
VPDPTALARIRALLFGTLVFGVVGMTAELLLLGHVESAWQWIPVVILGASVLLLAWHAAAPSRTTVRALQATMMLFIVTGGIGVGLHYDGNVEFELEMYPSMGGFELVAKTLTGATPVLAPGTMAILGLVGLALVYRHPAIEERQS